MPYIQYVPFTPGSHTSYKAAVSVSKTRGVKIAHLMGLYRQAGLVGLTDPEARRQLSEAVGAGVPVSSICSLRGALMDQGLVGKAGERMGDFGKRVQVWFWIGE
jgi:hypothetical protein